MDSPRHPGRCQWESSDPLSTRGAGARDNRRAAQRVRAAQSPGRGRLERQRQPDGARLLAAAESGSRRLQLRPRLLGRLCVPGHVRPGSWTSRSRRGRRSLFSPVTGTRATSSSGARTRTSPAARPLVQHAGACRPDVRRPDDPDRVRGHPRLRPHEFREPAAGRPGARDGRVAHRDPRAGHGQQPRDHLQPDVGLHAPVHLDHRDHAEEPRRHQRHRHGSAHWRRAPATTAASSSARSTRWCARADHANVFDIGANSTPGGASRARSSSSPSRSPGSATSRTHRPPRPLRPATPLQRELALRRADVRRQVIILGWEPGGGSQPSAGDPTRPSRRAGSSTTPTPAPSSASSCCRGRRRRRELHDPQLQRRSAQEQGRQAALRARGRELPGRHQRRGLHDPAAAKEIAYADPPPLVPTQLGGDWSTYWYNGRIYESDITRTLLSAPQRPAVTSYFRTDP